MGVRLVLVTLAAVLSTNPVFAQAGATSAPRASGPARVSAAASDELRRLQAAGVGRERRHNDSVLNGALVGAATGIASGLAVCRLMEPWDTCLAPAPLLRLGAVGAGIGVAVDALIRRKDGAEQRGSHVSITPVARRGSKGLQVGVRF